MGTFSIWHWLIVLIIVALVFGTKKLRNVGEDLGAAVRGFKEGMKTAEEKTQEDAPSQQIGDVRPPIEGEVKDKKLS